jgi:methylated-DNA-[protein]-cysteine S-methyltransferase
MKTLDTARFPSPLGEIVLFADGDVLVALEFADRNARVAALRSQLERTLGPFDERATRDPAGAVSRLKRYFAGDVGALAEQPVHPHGTAFQQRVWKALRAIPAGETRGYGELAASLGAPNSSRAVGAANGSNPISLFVPCHRVIAADGSLHGYGGGLERKQWLLAHEGARPRESRESGAQLSMV